MLARALTIVETHNDLDVVKEDPADNVLLEAAVEHLTSYIVSGDQHLLKLKEVQSIKILRPAKFVIYSTQQLILLKSLSNDCAHSFNASLIVGNTLVVLIMSSSVNPILTAIDAQLITSAANTPTM